jgi:hypothetical protein
MQESIVNKISLVRGQKMAAVVSMEKGSIKKEENTCPITAAFFWIFLCYSHAPSTGKTAIILRLYMAMGLEKIFLIKWIELEIDAKFWWHRNAQCASSGCRCLISLLNKSIWVHWSPPQFSPDEAALANRQVRCQRMKLGTIIIEGCR